MAFIMGPDDRDELNGAELLQPEIRQVGVITIADGGFVSGFVTGANCDVLVSAGHAAFYAEDAPNGEHRAGSPRADGLSRFSPVPGQDELISMTLAGSGFETPANVGQDVHDWAIFRLARPAYQDCRQLNIAGNAMECPGKLLLPAFHYDRRDTRLIDRTCSIRDTLGDRIIVHDCDTKDGSSGAPLLCDDKGVVEVIGINISGVSERELVEPGEYGQDSREYDYRNHKNFALNLGGEFLDALGGCSQRSTS